MKSVTLFNKHASSIEDYILSKKKITFDKDENFYQEILNDYFISSGLKYENFSQKLKEYLMELDNVGNNTIIIAEAGVNYNGKLEYAKRFISAAKCRCDYVKFQLYDTDELVTKTAAIADYQKILLGNIKANTVYSKNFHCQKRKL